MFYIVLLFLVLFFFYSVGGRGWETPKGRKMYILISGILFLIYYVFKDNGPFPDLADYFDLYKDVGKVSFGYLIEEGSPNQYNYELGYLLYNKVLSTITTKSFFLVLSNSIVVVFSYFLFIKRYSAFPFMAIALFLFSTFYQSLFIYRQFLAISICLFSIPYILNNRFIPFLFCCLLAFSFHSSAAVFLLLYFLYHFKINKTFIIVCVSLGIVAVIYRLVFIEYAIRFLGVSEVYMMANESNGGGTSYAPFIINAIIFVFILIYGDVKKMQGIEKLMFQAMIIVLIIDISAIGLDGTISGRLTAYFTPCNLILIPNVCKRLKNKGLFREAVVTVVLLCFFIVFMGGFNYGFSF